MCIYSVMGEIDQISTNTFRYTTCCAANVYMFVYILIGAHIVPLKPATINEANLIKACYDCACRVASNVA